MPRLASRPERGFVLALVVFLLFAVGLASTLAFRLVQAEWRMAMGGEEAMEAGVVARSGLDRYVAERLGIPVEHTYAIGDASVTITPRKVRDVDPETELWYLEASASVADSRLPEDPARRRAGLYALLHTQPVARAGAVVVSSEVVELRSSLGWGGRIDGSDAASSGDCSGGGTENVIGVVSRDDAVTVSSGWSLDGLPPQAEVGGHEDIQALAGIRWDVLTDPGFPIAHEGYVPSWWSLAPDSFPVVRYDGNLRADWSWSGRGVLIVTGALQPWWGFWWEGLILAGSFDSSYAYTPMLMEGAIVAGLNGSGDGALEFGGFANIRYHSCNVKAANRSLAYLEPLDDGFWEGY
jgi:hypothetical protein